MREVSQTTHLFTCLALLIQCPKMHLLPFLTFMSCKVLIHGVGQTSISFWVKENCVTFSGNEIVSQFVLNAYSKNVSIISMATFTL